MVTLGAQQPFFLPDFHYFYKLFSSDIFLIADFLKFRKQSPIVRTRLKLGEDQMYLTVPVIREGGVAQPPITQIQLLPDNGWRRRHLSTISSGFRKYPFFEFYFPLLEEVYQRSHHDLGSFLIDIIQWHVGVLFPKKTVRVASREGIVNPEDFSGWLGKLGNFSFLVYPSEAGYYQQRFGIFSRQEIAPNVSFNFPASYRPELPLVILLFAWGPETISYFLETRR